MEALLHYCWKHKIFPLQPLHTTDGKLVEVIDTGLPNRDAGPDFFNAKLRIDGVEWAGNVEIHLRASDWMRHGHDKDKTYDNVILHVVQVADAVVSRTDGEPVAQMELHCPEDVSRRYDELKQADFSPSCFSVLSSLPQITVHSWFSALQVERYEQRTKAIGQRLEKCQGNWRDAFFITLSRNFGFGVNGQAFEQWAMHMPWRAVDRHRDNLLQVEAFFYGMAGLLEDNVPGADAYYVELQKAFQFLRYKFQLPDPMPAGQWRFLRMNPRNFPHIRLAQLASLYHREQFLFSRVMEAENLKDVRQILSGGTSPYWEDHYSFNRPSERKQPKVLGEGTQNLLIINTVIPFLYAYGKSQAHEALLERATRFLEELKAENNYITRQWANAGLPVSTAADSQALIQLQREYCEKKDCLRCRFGYEYLRKG